MYGLKSMFSDFYFIYISVNRFIKMQKHILFFIITLFSNPLSAQLVATCPPGQSPAENCDDACVFCDINGYVGSTVGYQGTHTITCGCIYIDNDQWLAFVAGDTMADFTLTGTGCVNHNGMQMAIYENCNSSPIDCNCGVQGGQGQPLQLENVPLSPGTTYYLMIDGWSNDKCSFVLTVNPPAAVIANPIGTSIGPIQGPDIICPGATVTYSVPPVYNAGSYTWTVPAGWKINGQNSPQHLYAIDGGNSVKIKVGTTSGQICVQAANSCFPNGPSICKDIIVGPAPVNVLPPAYVCNEDKPYSLPWGEQAFTSGVYQKTLLSIYKCDSTVQQELIIRPPLLNTLPDTAICVGDSLAVCGFKYAGSGHYSCTCQSYQGCDSLVNFNLSVLAPQAEISGSATLNCATTSILLNASPSPAGTLFRWKNGAGQDLGDSTHLLVTSPGVYVLNATLKSGGTQCVKTDTILIMSNTVSPAVFATGGVLNCLVEVVELNANTNVASSTWAWSGPNIFSASITNPSVSLAGAYTVTVTDLSNGCTASVTTLVISDTLSPVISASGATLSCADTLMQLDVSAAPATVIYQWAGPNGFLSAVPSPVVAMPGLYTVAVTDTTNHCLALDTAEVLLNDIPPGALASVNGVISCPTPTIVLNGNSPTSGAVYSWTGPNNFSDSLQNPSANLAGTYHLLITGLNGCTSSSSVDVTGDLNTPDIAASAGTLSCGDPMLVLQGSSGTTGVTFAWTGPNGFTAMLQNPLTSDTGVYTLTVTALNECTATMEAIVHGDFGLPELHATTDTITCWNPAVDLSAGSLTPGTTFQWTGPGGFFSQLDTVSTDSSGVYTLTATAPNGCAAQTVIFVPIDIAGPGAAAQADTLTCAMPLLNLAGSSGLLNVHWHWTGPGNFISTEQHPGIQLEGLYQLEVTGFGNGCTSTASVLVEVDKVAPVAGSDTGTLTCSLDSLLLTGASNVAATFTWSGPAGFVFTGATPVVVLPGDYTLVVRSLNNGCVDSVSVTVDQDIAPPDAGVQGGTLDCNNTQIAISGSSATPGAVYYWTGPNNFSASVQNPAVSNPGQYVLTVSGPNGCQSSATAEVLEDIDVPVVNLDTPDTLTCAVSNLILTSEIQTAGASGVWSGPNNFSSDSSSITISIPGTYTFTVTAPNGCSSTPALTALQDTLPPQSVNTQGGLLNCAIQNIPIQAGSSAATSYQWSGPGGFISSLQTPTVVEPGDYTVTLTGLVNGCTATATATVTQDLTEPDIAVQSDSLTCLTTSVILEATSNTPDVSFVWAGPNNFVSDLEDPSTDQPGVYTLTVTGSNGCSTEFQYAVHQNIAHPVVSASGDTLSCSAPSGLLVSQSQAASAVFAWSGPGNFTASNAIATVSASGLYTVVVTTPNGCSSSVQVTVAADTLTPLATAFGGTLTCLDSLVALSALSNVAVSWQWTGPGNFNAQDQNPQVSMPGDYLLKATAANGCIGVHSATVEDQTQSPALGISPPDSLDCATVQVMLEAQVAAGGSYDFKWHTADGLILSGVGNPTAIAIQAGQYSVQVTDLSNGCSAVAETAVLRNHDLPSGVQLNRRNISCFGEIDGAVEIISVDGGTAPFVYSIDSLDFTTAYFYQGLTAGTHLLRVQDDNGCIYTTSFEIEALEELLLDLGPDTTILLGQSIELSLEGCINYPDRVAETHISPTDLELPVTLVPLHSFQYHVTVFDSNGCELRDSRRIIVRKERWVYIPNTFNPHSDDNGLLYVFGGKDVQMVKAFSVFDRWGNHIFEKREFLPNDSAAGWDGRYRGAVMAPAVFVYYAEVLFIDGETRVYRGDVTLLR